MAMKSESLLPYFTAQSRSGAGMFNTAMGKLQRHLYKGEYDIFKYAPIFESDFIQITKRGEVIDVHNRVRMVTVGIACTSPILPLPDVMLLARPAMGFDEFAGRGQTTKGRKHKSAKNLELTRLLPLKFVRISVHDQGKQQLRLKFATGRSCYLQLCPSVDVREDLFAYWEKLIYLLRPPVDSNSSTYAIPAEDMICMPAFEEEDRKSLATADFQGKGDQDQVSVRSLNVVSDVHGATSAAYAGGEGLQHDSHKSIPMSDGSNPQTKSIDLAKESATGAVAGTLSVVVSKSAGQISAAIAGGAVTGARRSKSHIAIAGTGKMSPKSLKVALAGAASKSLENISSTVANVSPQGSMTVAIARVYPTNKTAGETENDSAAGPLTSSLSRESPTHGQTEQQTVSPISAEVHKEKRERRERREKDRAHHHHHRTGESHRKTGGDKTARKSSDHIAARGDNKEKSQGSPRDDSHSSSHKGISHIPITKESRTSHKPGKNFPTGSSASTGKRLSKISSFLRNIRANVTTKGGASPRDRDIMAKTVGKTNMETIIEAAESDQALEITGSVTSEIMESMTFEAH
uniref:Protein FAM71A n=1 Tax=Castor canadensis TaxID=51338 RepID=A0A8B7V914_CASCN|nr:protein FAM71A [Castor canadensis]